MNEYKGIYYGSSNEQKFYEGGAHFKYSALYKILKKLAEKAENKSIEEEEYSIKETEGKSHKVS
ncbi:MAG: hypothetical protein MJ252_27900 [archaeon]|nr:hypothetical protein [archaeon]